MPSPDADREEAIKKFAELQGQVVADALRANPPTVILPDPVVQALLKLAANVGTGSAGPPVLDPIAAMQAQLQLQNQQGAQLGRVVVQRFDLQGKPWVQQTTLPQLLAELCDMMHSQVRLLERTLEKLERKRRGDL